MHISINTRWHSGSAKLTNLSILRLTLLCILVASTPVKADIIFTDNFQDGIADGWQAMGKGDVKLTKYQSNVSLSLSHQASAITHFSASGFQSLTATVSLAARSLEKDEHCIAEISVNKGQSWQTIKSIGSNQADAITLYKGATTLKQSKDADSVYIRFGVKGNQANDTCWFDNIRVSGQRFSQADSMDTRKPFSAQNLIKAKDYETPLHTSTFKPSSTAIPARYSFEGEISITSPLHNGGSVVLKDLFPDQHKINLLKASIPLFQTGFIQDGDQLIPTNGHIIEKTHPRWNILLSTGKVWSEPDENAFSRGAIPFALQEKNKNCTHNGLMTFLYNDKNFVSEIAVQITSETCRYYQFNMWGYVKGAYQPKIEKNKSDIIERYNETLHARLPQKTISELGDNYPDVSFDQFASNLEINPDDLTLFGLIVDGVHYVGGCDTRYGPYPYCDSLALPSYSLAKSIFAGLAMMRLDALYPGIMDEEIAQYIPACQTKKWRGVTFRHVLNMQTGNYDSGKYMLDEDSQKMSLFFNEDRHAKNIEMACSMFKHRSKPGKKWVYHTSDTYILGTAMQNYLNKMSDNTTEKSIDNNKSIYEGIYQTLIVKPLWHELKLSPVSEDTLRTNDKRRQAFLGYGLTFYRDDIARIAAMLQGNPKNITLLLNQQELNIALQLNQKNEGAVGKSLGYRNGFWSTTFHNIGDCTDPVKVPFMSGYGGITVALLPNNIVYYYFSDNNDFVWRMAVEEAHKIKPFHCKSK